MKTNVMSRPSGALFALSLYLPLSCGAPDSTRPSDLKILHGTAVGLFDQAPKSTVGISGPNGLCTGVIIDSRHILTAAHCETTVGSTVSLYAGPLPNGIAFPVTRVFTRLGVNAAQSDFFDDTGVFADVAVLRIQGQIPFPYEAAELASIFPGSLVNGWAVGKGSHDSLPNPNRELRWTDATTLSVSDSLGFFLMAGQKTNTGDSGGPFFVSSDSSGKLRVVGVLSGGEGIDTFGVDAYASVAYFRAWINAQVNVP